MRFILTAVIFLAGLFDLFMGLNFLLDPAAAGASFGLGANSAGGLSAIRADFSAFFLVSAGCMMWGAWRRNGDLLLVPAALFGVAFIGRAVSAVVDGTIPGFWAPMAIEAFHVVLMMAAWRLLPHHKIDEIAG